MSKKAAAGLSAIVFVAALGAVLSSSSTTTAIAQNVPPIFQSLIVNDAEAPIPVAGDVVASVDGTVQVEGAVDVANVPSELTDRLDLLIEEIRQLRDDSAAPQPANFTEVYRDDQIQQFGGELLGSFGREVLVSFLSISTENDRGRFRLCAPGIGGCAIGGARYAVGEDRKEFPGVLTVSFPQPVPATGVYFQCVNEFEDCEVTITVIGSVAN